MNLMLILLAATAPAQAAQVPGLETHWNFDEGGGLVAADTGPRMNTGAVFPVAISWSSDFPPATGSGGSLDFKGGCVWAGSSIYGDLSGSFTVSFWAKPSLNRPSVPESATAWVDIRDQQLAMAPAQGDMEFGAGHAGLGVSIGTNGVSVITYDGTMRALLNHDAALGGWTCVTVVVTSNRPTLYLGGTEVRTGLQSAQTLHPSGELGVGKDLSFGDYRGLLDDVRIYNRALTSQEVRTLANPAAPVVQPTPGGAPAEAGGGSDTGSSSAGCGGSAAVFGGGVLAMTAGLFLLRAPDSRLRG